MNRCGMVHNARYKLKTTHVSCLTKLIDDRSVVKVPPQRSRKEEELTHGWAKKARMKPKRRWLVCYSALDVMVEVEAFDPVLTCRKWQ
eukprot:6071295-Amphidinium_carterae.1